MQQRGENRYDAVTIGTIAANIFQVDAELAAGGGYFVVRYTGVRTYARIIALIDEVERNALQTGILKYLFDLRESEEGFSLVDKYNLGIHLAQVFGEKYSVAVLIRREHITGFLENVSLNRGASRFMITDDEAEARGHLI
jgi:hypothetical protein